MIDQLIRTGLLVRDVPLGPLTTYKAGGPAALFAEITTMEELNDLVGSGVATEHPVLVLGRGSNLVVSDTGFAGLVIKLSGEFMTAKVEGDRIEAGGAMPLPRLARQAVEAGVLGLEFFVGVPGSVGGAVRQNAGCFGTETKDVLESANLLDLRTGGTALRSARDLDLAYRHSNVASTDLVMSASFRGQPGESRVGKDQMREITRWRKENQPGGTLNAGSVFKNPGEVSAGELIDELGLKGARVGDVSVSEKHANFFVAGPAATADDIRRLVELVKDTVFEQSGTMLEPEIQFVGFDQ